MIKNIVFAGTPLIAANLLLALIAKGYKIAACLTRQDKPTGRNKQLTSSPVKDIALNNNIVCLQPKKLSDPLIINTLKELHPDLMIVFAYGLILPDEVLSIPKFGCFNVHTSLLPKLRGAAPVQHAILSRDKVTGISIIKMSKELDAGDICYQLNCDIDVLETSESLYQKLQPLAIKATIKVLEQINTNQLNLIAQEHNKATYASKINKQDAKINWYYTTKQIDSMVRAFIPKPIAFTKIANLAVRIWQASNGNLTLTNTKQLPIPGTIISFTQQGIDVATIDGVIRLEKLQFPGSKVLSAKDLFNSIKYRALLIPGAIFT